MCSNGNSFGVGTFPELTTLICLPSIFNTLRGWPNK